MGDLGGPHFAQPPHRGTLGEEEEELRRKNEPTFHRVIAKWSNATYTVTPLHRYTTLNAPFRTVVLYIHPFARYTAPSTGGPHRPPTISNQRITSTKPALQADAADKARQRFGEGASHERAT